MGRDAPSPGRVYVELGLAERGRIAVALYRVARFTGVDSLLDGTGFIIPAFIAWKPHGHGVFCFGVSASGRVDFVTWLENPVGV